jgi:hypothetical protein
LDGSHFTTKRHIVPLIADALPALTSIAINHTISAAARQRTSVAIVDESASANRRAVTTALDDLGFFA